jgi:hypothetical protein
MSESENLFEEFVKRIYFKFDKMQIEGFHKNSTMRVNRSVSPIKKIEGYSSGF